MKNLPGLRHAGVYLRALGRQKPLGKAAKPYPWESAYPAGASWNFDIQPQPVYRLLDNAVATHPKKICLTFQGKKYTYRQIGELVAGLAAGLGKLGVGRGTKVGLFLPNSSYFVICYYAILKAGGTVVNFNPLYAERAISRQIEDSETSIIITLDSKSLYTKIAKLLGSTRLKRVIVCPMNRALKFPHNLLFGWLRRAEAAQIPADERHVMFHTLIRNTPDQDPAEIDPEHDVAVLQYTGGISGSPKGAMLTHANLYINALQIKRFSACVKPRNETSLVLLPLCHAFGMTVMNFAFAIGAELVLLPRFKIGEVLDTIQRRRCTLLFGVPTIYSALSSHKDVRKYDLSSLRTCISGGAPFGAEIKSAFEKVAGCATIDGYGLTEASPVCTLVPLGGAHKAGSVGLPLPGTIIEISSLRHPLRRLPCGEPGEICVRGPQVMAGYWKQPQETDAVLKGGLLRTGDFGYIDEDGYLFVVDRVKDMIISGGFNIYPRMVQEAIEIHPVVLRAMVCGVPDQHRGERVKAYVQVREGAELTIAELRGFLKDKLAPFEMPSEIEFLGEFPRELVQRVERRTLLEQKFGNKKPAPFWPRVRRLSELFRGWLITWRPSGVARS